MKRHALDVKHNSFVQATKLAYRCGSDADAINLLLDFIQDGTLETALPRIRMYQDSPEIHADPQRSTNGADLRDLAAILPEDSTRMENPSQRSRRQGAEPGCIYQEQLYYNYGKNFTSLS